jgi:hypothetical protein
MAAEREGVVVKKGHDEGMKMAVALLEEFGLPLAYVIEVGFVRSTGGYMWSTSSRRSASR